MIDDVQYFAKENKIWNLKIWFLSILPIYIDRQHLQAQGREEGREMRMGWNTFSAYPENSNRIDLCLAFSLLKPITTKIEKYKTENIRVEAEKKPNIWTSHAKHFNIKIPKIKWNRN
jgi:hypothetical protein